MIPNESQIRNRRQFLRFLAGSPFAALPLSAWQAQLPSAGVLASPKDALNVMDFEEAARRALPPAHWGYMATGVDDDATLRANREGFKHIQLRPRRLVDVSKVDLRTDVFGTAWEAPIFICPVGEQKAFNPEGEVATARAARAKKAVQILSTVTSFPVEEVAKALGTPPWYQLYMPSRWEATEKMVRRVEAAGCPVLVWTVDLLGGRNTETMERFRRTDTRDCAACHTSPRGGAADRPMFDGIQGGINPSSATWDYVDRLKKMTRMKLMLKGIETREDARLCREHGVDGIVVSNHGGRATEDLRPTIDSLPEVVEAAGGQIPVLVDGGFRRGTDIFKALALGARAVGIGRPYIYGLSSFGQEGVERVLDILRAELQMVMKQCGTTAIAQITRASVAIGDVRF
ncbi:MAG: alpha-hydroxy acid oxidase [Bryobacteraceae bacterium]|jgi:isopentenyl diphosphate isomerase/L-lactate dehydrogenase-like FMN-dependent dehydrogenase